MFRSIIGCVFICSMDKLCDNPFKSSEEAIRCEIENNKKKTIEEVKAKKGK